MKLVQYAFTAFVVLFVTACGSDTPGSGNDKGPGDEKCDVESTFAQVQQQIFENRGCTASACHGESATGGLDLTPSNAYASLINVASGSGDYVRVFPGEQDLSALVPKGRGEDRGLRTQLSSQPDRGRRDANGP